MRRNYISIEGNIISGEIAKDKELAPAIRCWVMTDGRTGMETQCLGLAEALGLTPEIKRIRTRLPWSILPPQFWLAPLSAPGPGGDRLRPPWPDLLIATGRQAVAPAIGIKKASPQTVIVQIQNPTVDVARFDLVIAPAHDRLAGANVLSTIGSIHRVTEDRMADEKRNFAARYAALPRPLIGVLIGGDNRQYRMSAASTQDLVAKLREAVKDGGSLVITPSRRTGTKNIALIRQGLEGVTADIWDGTGDNPYFGILALADAIVVTGDSVNMMTEACATGKPVHVFQLEGNSRKFDRFHARLAEGGMTRPFTGTIEHWRYDPPDDVARAVAAVRDCLGHVAAPGATGDHDN
jgi:hypothetical protein